MKLKLRYRLVRSLAPILAAFWTGALWSLELMRRGYVNLRAIAGDVRKALRFHLVRLWIHYFLAVSECAKCPACGIRAKHTIQWVDVYQRVMHECARCKAHWGELPVAKLESWFVKPVQMPDEDEPIAAGEARTTSKIRQVV